MVRKKSIGILAIILIFLMLVLLCGGSATALALQQEEASSPAVAASPVVASTPAGNSGADIPVVNLAKEITDNLEKKCGPDLSLPDPKHPGQYLSSCSYRFFRPNFPKEVIDYGKKINGGVTWSDGFFQCVSMVMGSYSQVYPMPISDDAHNFWNRYNGVPGWIEIAASSGEARSDAPLGFPDPGDVLVMTGGIGGYGHVAIITNVVMPVGNTPGKATFASANSLVQYDDLTLQADGTATSPDWKGYTVVGYIRPDFHGIARQDATHHNIDPNIYEQQIQQESKFVLDAKSPAGAEGIAQIMPGTADGWGVDPWNPFASLDIAAGKMRDKLDEFGGSYEKALAAYNAGDGAVYQAVSTYGDGWLSHMPQETQDYVKIILRE